MTHTIHGVARGMEEAMAALQTPIDAILLAAEQIHGHVLRTAPLHGPTSAGLPYACLTLRRLHDGRTIVRERIAQHGVAHTTPSDTAHHRLGATAALEAWNAHVPALMEALHTRVEHLLHALATMQAATGRGPDHGQEATRQMTISVGENMILASLHHAEPEEEGSQTWDSLCPSLWLDLTQQRPELLALAGASATADSLARGLWHVHADAPPARDGVPHGARHHAKIREGLETMAALRFALLCGNRLLPHTAAAFSIASDMTHNLHFTRTLEHIQRAMPSPHAWQA